MEMKVRQEHGIRARTRMKFLVYWIRLHLAASVNWRAGKRSLKEAVKWRKGHLYASLILPTEILGRGFSLTSNVVLL